jgi:hypothetical protein
MREHLTVPDNPVQAQREKQTPDGMAFWAGTGPQGMACRRCGFWNGGYYERSRPFAEVRWLSPARCQKYIQMMEALRPDAPAPRHRVPWDTPSCKYFQLDPLAPPPFKQKGVKSGRE